MTSSRRLFKHRVINIDFHSLKTRSRKINWLKRVLPFMALVLLGTLFFWSGGKKIIFLKSKDVLDKSLNVFANNMALQLRFNGVDNHGRPYTIWAEQAKQISTDVFYLTSPKFHLTIPSGESIELQSKEGTFFKDRKILELNENVILKHFKGDEINTASATIHFDQGIAFGNDPVKGHGPNGAIQAKGFKLLDKGNTLIFLGQSELIINSDKKSSQQ